MFRRSPRATLLWIVAFAVAIATATHVAGLLSSLENQEREFGRVQSVVVAARDLQLGRRVATDDLAIRRIRGDTFGKRSFQTVTSIVGTIVRVPLLSGSVITSRHVTKGNRGAGSPVVPNGLRVMRVPNDKGVRPAVGDVIDLYATFDPQVIGDSGDPTITLVTAALVVASTTADIDVVVTPDEAKRIAFATMVGEISVAIAPPEEASNRYG
ncbi:MAG: hypothetical protein EXQ69_02560 [Acidimicrobiia bacterium]|nr:hypothetical protein [Acidimicrobiia bacterium]